MRRLSLRPLSVTRLIHAASILNTLCRFLRFLINKFKSRQFYAGNQISLEKKIEKRAIYSALFLYFVLQLAAMFIPSVASFMSAGGSLAFIAGILLIIFRFLDERLDGKPDSLKSSNSFVQSVSAFLRENKEYKSVDILAQNGFLYYTAIKESGVKIRNLRILFRSAKDLTVVQFPSDEKGKEGFKQQLSQMVMSFEQLQRSGVISKLSIAYYEFDLMTYFMLLDGKLVHFGLYQPKTAYPGSDVTNSYFVSNEGQGENLVKDFTAQFDALWAKYNNSPKNPLRPK
jgi:hypothetical protein